MAKKKYPMWNPEMEAMPRDELRKLQFKRFQDVVKMVYEKVPFYKGLLDEAGLKPQDIKTWDDVAKIPFTTKQDLRNNYPFGTFAVPPEGLAQIHATSGTMWIQPSKNVHGEG